MFVTQYCKNVLCNLHVLASRELIVRMYSIIQKLRVFSCAVRRTKDENHVKCG